MLWVLLYGTPKSVCKTCPPICPGKNPDLTPQGLMDSCLVRFSQLPNKSWTISFQSYDRKCCEKLQYRY